ncbi:hypothetical protein CRYUN_Cryun01aG0039800 [Craigia yunnanensis]
MAEDVVSLAIERISDLLIHEAVYLGGVGEELERLRAELDRMNSVLKDADFKQEQTELLRTLVRQIRDLAYEAEDVIDSFILEVAHQGELVNARCSCDDAQGLNGLKLGELVVTPKVKHGQNKGNARKR